MVDVDYAEVQRAVVEKGAAKIGFSVSHPTNALIIQQSSQMLGKSYIAPGVCGRYVL
jgi:hypothetical protein